MEEFRDLEKEKVDRIMQCVREYEVDMRIYLADFVAEICGVTKEDMLSGSDETAFAHARWLYWYALKYMTGDSYKKLSENTTFGHKFSSRAMQNASSKIWMMIANDGIWKNRWSVVKQVIKQRFKDEDGAVDNTIVIQVPAELKNKINIVTKDK